MGFSRQDFSPTVTHSLRRLLQELGGTFSHEHLRGYIERWRGKPLRLEEDTMPPGMTGYAIALRDCDLIATRRGLTKTQKKITQLHEMAHFINGDLPLYSHGGDHKKLGGTTPKTAALAYPLTQIGNPHTTRERLPPSHH